MPRLRDIDTIRSLLNTDRPWAVYALGDLEPEHFVHTQWHAAAGARALVMLYLDERPYAEIADVLGLSESNVATKINRIKQRLREQMTRPTPTWQERKHGTR